MMEGRVEDKRKVGECFRDSRLKWNTGNLLSGVKVSAPTHILPLFLSLQSISQKLVSNNHGEKSLKSKNCDLFTVFLKT